MVAAAPVLPVGYVVSASRIADRRMILAGYRLADGLGGNGPATWHGCPWPQGEHRKDYQSSRKASRQQAREHQHHRGLTMCRRL
jgi:hypothetical protein